MIFAGGKPALFAIMLFLRRDLKIRIAQAEYPAYHAMMDRLGIKNEVVSSNEKNGFKPANADYIKEGRLALFSNPGNPTGQTKKGEELNDFVKRASKPGCGALIDEAYELMYDTPVSSLEYIKNIDKTNIFVTGACTKGLQAPGIRIGWCIASKANIDILGNFATIQTGGVSHLSQLYAIKLFEEKRVALARTAIPKFYGKQRERYAKAFKELGLEIYSGNGGFYHWFKLPGTLTAREFNERLFPHGAAILCGDDCDMKHNGNGAKSPLKQFVRFSFGPLEASSFDNDIKILRKALNL